VILAGFCVNVALLVAQAGAVAVPVAPAAPKSEILGVWKGTSTCTDRKKFEFCRDETVVYRFVDVPDQPETVSLKASRVVDQVEVAMFALYFSYQAATRTWDSAFERPGFRGVWSYAVHGDAMTGTATLVPQGTVVRNVSVKRAPQDQAAGADRVDSTP